MGTELGSESGSGGESRFGVGKPDGGDPRTARDLGWHLRPRLATCPVRWAETRSAADLDSALAGKTCPIVVIDLGRRVCAGLEDLDRAMQLASAMVLVFDPEAHEGVAVLARELGATHVISGPPRHRLWPISCGLAPAAQRQAEGEGWSSARPPRPRARALELAGPPAGPARSGRPASLARTRTEPVRP